MDGIKLSPKYGVNPTIPVCFWCGKEKNEIALMGRVGNARKHEDIEMPMRAVIDYIPCEECEKAMAMGVTVIEATQEPNEITEAPIREGAYPTGKWSVITKESAHRIFPDLGEEKTMLFATENVYEQMFGNL